MCSKYLLFATAYLAGFLNATPAPGCPAPHAPGLVDLGYAKHIPTFINKTSSGLKVFIYKNIRFAKPPTGDLRFRWPNTDIDHTDGVQDGGASWDGRNCISSAPSSIPFPDISGRTWGQEDCLFLDVYVPEGVKPGDNVPVLHFIHGGAYAFGNKEFLTSPMGLFDHMFQQNLGRFIFVINNYRYIHANAVIQSMCEADDCADLESRAGHTPTEKIWIAMLVCLTAWLPLHGLPSMLVSLEETVSASQLLVRVQELGLSTI